MMIYYLILANITWVSFTLYVLYLYFSTIQKLKQTDQSLRLVFNCWHKSLEIWYRINLQHATSQNQDINSFYEECIRQVCVEERTEKMQSILRNK